MLKNPFEDMKIEPLKLYEDKLDAIMQQGDRIIALVTATKPDFYKQWSLIPASEKHNMPLFVINTGQHYDQLLGHGLEEFRITEKFAISLNIRGDLSQKTAELVTKISWFAKYLKTNYPKKTVIPIIHGDTHAAGIVPQAWMFATNQKCAQNEAGLRSMSPDFKNYRNIDKFITDQFETPWHLNTVEPFPEQYDTMIAGASSHWHFAPTELNREHLIREGYPEKNIPVVGNSVVDAIAHKKKEKSDSSIFDIYPVLEKKDNWIRIDIHRRANLLPERFKAIMDAVIKLVESGKNVNLINMNATSMALDNYGLKEKISKLEKNHDNFLFTGLWPAYSHVIEFLESGKCFAEFTDSGSMQEELNEIQKPLCLTARFNTDRPETVMHARTNLLIPPISGDYIVKFISRIEKDEDLKKTMTSRTRLYGKNVGEKIIRHMKKDTHEPFEWAHEREGIRHKTSKEFEFL